MDNNSIDFGRIYGISGDCPDGGCALTGNIVPNTPSLEQIARYNVQLQARQMPNPEIQRKLQTLEETIGEEVLTGFPEISDANAASPGNVTTSSGTVPNGMPGTQMMNQFTQSQLSPITEYNQPFPVTGESIQYLNGFMRTQIGRRVEIQMLVGSDTLVTKEGYLLGIGANYILINEVGTNDLTSCDFYNIKFVRYFY